MIYKNNTAGIIKDLILNGPVGIHDLVVKGAIIIIDLGYTLLYSFTYLIYTANVFDI